MLYNMVVTNQPRKKIMYSEEVKLAIKEHNTISIAKSKVHAKVAIKSMIMKETEWMPEDYGLSIRYYCIENDVYETPKCVCGADVLPDKLNQRNGFSKYCSIPCNQKYSRTNKKLMDFNYMNDIRVVQRKSYIEIGKTLGVSDVAVAVWCKKHGLPDEKYVWSDSATKEEREARTAARIKTQLGDDAHEKLYDKEWLRTEYEVLEKSPSKIARELNLSGHMVVVRAMEQHGIDYDPNRTYHSPELDVYLPEIKMGIEYNGAYAHSEARRDTGYHIKKVKHFNEKGIRVVQIWSDDWIYNKEVVKSFLNNLLGQSKDRIGARQTTYGDVSIEDYRKFLDNHHLLGFGKGATVKVGLYHDEKLVAVCGSTK